MAFQKKKGEEDYTDSFAPLPAGWYTATVWDVKVIDFSKKNGYAGNDGWNIQFKIASGQTGAGRIVFNRIYVGDTFFPSGSRNFTLFQFLDAFFGSNGFTKRYNAGESIDLPDIADVLGSTVDVQLKIEEYNGDKRNVVNRVREHTGAENKVEVKKTSSGKKVIDL